MIEILKNFPSLAVAQVELGKKTYATREAAAEWLTAKGFGALELLDEAGSWRAAVRGENEFVADSSRELLADGALVRVGLLASAVQKGAINPLPTFAPEQLRILGGLNLTEITLTANPILDSMAAFRVMKAAGAENASEAIHKAGEFAAIDAAQQIVYGYALVPDLPDHQGDIVPFADVELAGHSLLRNVAKGYARGEGVGVEHKDWDGIGYPVEVFFDRTGSNGIAGGLWVGTHVEDADTWCKVEKGDLRGYSIGGSSTRREVLPDLSTVLKARFAEDVTKASQTLDEIRAAVALAIRAKHIDDWAWIEAIYEDRVVYHRGDVLWMASYTIDEDGAASLDDALEVRKEYVAKAWHGTPRPITQPPSKEQEMTPDEVQAAIAAGIEQGVAKALEQGKPAVEPAAAVDPPAAPAAPDAPAEPAAAEPTLKSLDGKLDALLGHVEKHGKAIDDHAQRLDVIGGQPVRKGSAQLPIGGAVTASGDVSKGKQDLDWGDPVYGVHGRRS